jgi:hypothetical protein
VTVLKKAPEGVEWLMPVIETEPVVQPVPTTVTRTEPLGSW